MKLCFPVSENLGLESRVYGHFGSAPAFILFDSETGSVTLIPNGGRHHHLHGMCNPTAALEGRHIDAVVVGGIGPGALYKLNGAGISVFMSKGDTVRENIEMISSGQLAAFKPGHTCAGHGGKCSH